MPDTVRLRALRPLTVSGRVVQPGDIFVASPIEAAAYTYRHEAVFSSQTNPPVARSTRKRTYRRRDLRAET